MYILESDELDMKKIADSGQIFRFNELEKGYYNLIASNRVIDIKEKNIGVYTLSCDKEEFDNFWKDYFDLDTNYAAFKNSVPKDDIFLNEACEYSKGIRILKQDEFEMLISFIISQRKSIPSIKSSIEKLAKLYGEYLGDGRYAFPTPEKLSMASLEEINTCGLGYRNEYVIKSANMVHNKLINLKEIRKLNDEELLQKLMSLKGVGIKVANCVALFGYYRIDSFPIDVWIKRIIDTYYNGKFPLDMYKGYAGIIQQYIFYYGRSLKLGK